MPYRETLRQKDQFILCHLLAQDDPEPERILVTLQATEFGLGAMIL